MGAATGFQHHLGWRNLAEKRLKSSAGQVLTQHRPILLIDPVQGENGFGRINRNAL
jgi:hypothetical protein